MGFKDFFASVFNRNAPNTPVAENKSKISYEIDTSPLSAEEVADLDNNTIDTYFLPKVFDENGNPVRAEEAAYYSPFANQEDTDGAFYPDAWKPSHIDNGTILYQLSDNGNAKSSYFTDEATVDSCRDPNTGTVDIAALKEKLQMKDDENTKNTLTGYRIHNPSGLKVAEGYANENSEYGKGTGKQYFIPYANEYKSDGNIEKIGDLKNINNPKLSNKEEQSSDKINTTPLSAEEVADLDNNTIDTYFLPKVLDENGNPVRAEEAAYYSPFANQEDTDGEFYPDAWKPSHIDNGTILYQLSDNGNAKSSYFTDEATVDSCRDPNTGTVDIAALKEKLQMKDDENTKNTLTGYRIHNPSGLKVAEGYANENSEYGKGTGKQYFIPYANEYKSDRNIEKIGDLKNINNPKSSNKNEGQPEVETSISDQRASRSLHDDLNNPELFNKNAQGKYDYGETKYGKTASGNLQLETGERDSNAQRTVGDNDRRLTDDGGHLIGTRFNGAPDKKNLDAQDQNLNRGSYKIRENDWAKSLENGDKVFVNAESFKSNNSDRPDAFMGYSIKEHPDGTREWDAFSYQNESAATQDDWNQSIADNDLMDQYDNPIDYNPADYANELSDNDYTNKNSDNIDQPEDEDNSEGEDQPEGEDNTEGEDNSEGEDQPEGEDNTEGEDQPESEDQPEGEDNSKDTKQPEGEDNTEGEDNFGGEDQPEGEDNSKDTKQPEGEDNTEGEDNSEGEDQPEGEDNSKDTKQPEGEDNSKDTKQPEGEDSSKDTKQPEGEDNSKDTKRPEGEDNSKNDGYDYNGYGY